MEIKKKFIIDFAFYGIVLGLLIAFYQYIIPILMPFIIGFCVASIVRIPLKKMKLKKAKHKRWMAALMCAVFYVIVVGLLVLLGYKLVTEIGNFAAAIPDLLENVLLPFFRSIARQIEQMLMPINPELADLIIDAGRSVAQSLISFATDLSTSLVKWVANSAVGIPGLIIQIILTVVSSFYMSIDYRLVLNFLKKLIPESKRSFTLDAIQYAKTAVLAFIKTYSILFGVTFFELSIGLLILKIPYAMAIAFGIALFDLMPILGTGGILLPWIVILLCLGNFPLAIGILVLYLVITAVRNFLESRIVGNEIGLHPLATLIAMILGLNLMGILGMLFFPITLVALTNMRKSAKRQESKDEPSPQT